MENLSFRVVYVPKLNSYSENEEKKEVERFSRLLQFDLEACGLKEIDVQPFRMVKTEDDEKYPEVEECMFQVHAKCTRLHTYQKSSFYYQKLSVAWKNLDTSRDAVLVFNENSAFDRMQFLQHSSVEMENIAFGTLPFNGDFYEYGNMIPMYVDFYHDLKEIRINCHGTKYMVLHYNNIKNVFVNIDSKPYEVFFDVVNPPLVFKEVSKRNRFIGNYTLKYRTCSLDFLSFYGHNFEKITAFGLCNVLRFSFKNAAIAQEIVNRIHFRCEKKPILFACIKSDKRNFPYVPTVELQHYIDFSCTYLLHAIFQRNVLSFAQSQNIANNLSRVRDLCSKKRDCLEKALTLVLAAIDSGKIINVWKEIEKQYLFYMTYTDEIEFDRYVIPEKCRKIRRVTITPSRQLFWAPEVMFGNRVLRNFDSEYAIRVSFRDDNNSRLSFHAPYSTDDYMDLSVRKPMTNGLKIGYRLYEFLAWSNSQIRDHGVWMYAEDANHNTVRTIRSWMGDFSHIHSVPKYMARMGQCFSQTEDAIAVPLDSHHIRVEEDIEGGLDPLTDKPYCFSDGVGKISSALAEKVYDAIGHDKLCSAFQIRYGGCKGMLVIDPTLKNTDIVFRKSMKKFDSPQNIRLEIAKTSAPITLQLNRPFIALLDDLGVQRRKLMKLQDKTLHTLTEILFDEEKAFRFLESKTPSDLFAYKALSRSGVYLTDEPFFRSLLLALHRHHIEKIKTKANIPIDPSRGRNMLGVLDETGRLHYGEVFVQYTKDISFGQTTQDTEILRGQVLVTKNPCLLPGDVRKFHAVDIPELRHIVDCIVFPQRGPRPHPNEMGGSDLDGDEYAVLWDPDFIFKSANREPGHFPSSSAPEVLNITDQHMIEFLVTYIKSDQVGAIANAHLAHADRDGTASATCINIAKKFSYAVDFAKTGVIHNLEPVERPNEFPDFMEKSHKDTYRSEKALGKLYRVAVDYESENVEASESYEKIQIDADLEYPGWETYEDDAIKSRNKFNTLLKTVLRNYGIQHEAEVFSGAFTNLHRRFSERKDRDEIEKVIVRCIKRLSACMREEFLAEFADGGNVKELEIQMSKKASAWYMVTYSDKNAKFLSFPWTVSKYLATIKILKRGKQQGSFSPIIERMDKDIKLCEIKNFLPFYQFSAVASNWDFLCGSPAIVEKALRVLLLWAEEEDIIQKPGLSQRGFIFTEVFVKLFFYIAELSGYVANKSSNPSSAPVRNQFSSAELCLEFFKFCLTLRFYNKFEVVEVLPFQVYKYSYLSKRAVVTYHRFALLGKFRNLYSDVQVKDDYIQMKPININAKIFQSSPIGADFLKKASEAIQKLSGADVSMREIRQTKKVLVSATGTEESLKIVKSILRKKDVQIRHLFIHGSLPET